jgi:hypothetical protein
LGWSSENRRPRLPVCRCAACPRRAERREGPSAVLLRTYADHSRSADNRIADLGDQLSVCFVGHVSARVPNESAKATHTHNCHPMLLLCLTCFGRSDPTCATRPSDASTRSDRSTRASGTTQFTCPARDTPRRWGEAGHTDDGSRSLSAPERLPCPAAGNAALQLFRHPAGDGTAGRSGSARRPRWTG